MSILFPGTALLDKRAPFVYAEISGFSPVIAILL